MNQGDFIAGYCMRSGITIAFFLEIKVAMPCNCDYEECCGWAAITKMPANIQDHEFFYMWPKKPGCVAYEYPIAYREREKPQCPSGFQPEG